MHPQNLNRRGHESSRRRLVSGVSFVYSARPERSRFGNPCVTRSRLTAGVCRGWPPGMRPTFADHQLNRGGALVAISHPHLAETRDWCELQAALSVLSTQVHLVHVRPRRTGLRLGAACNRRIRIGTCPRCRIVFHTSFLSRSSPFLFLPKDCPLTSRLSSPSSAASALGCAS